jgi:hypothetical protein
VQSVQVAGDGNVARNATTLVVRNGAVPASSAGNGACLPRRTCRRASASAGFDGNQARLLLQVMARAWSSNGYATAASARACPGRRPDRQQPAAAGAGAATAGGNLPLSQNVAQAIAMNRGMGPGR